MPIIFSTYELGGTESGSPIIMETGLCTAETGSRTTLNQYETGRVQFEPVPRRSGLIAKDLDGVDLAPLLVTLSGDGLIDEYPSCMQVGRTQFKLFAPEQPIGPYSGLRILSFVRRWVQLSPNS